MAGDSVGASRNQFTGKERDAESGLDYFGARYFSGQCGDVHDKGLSRENRDPPVFDESFS